MSCDITQNTEHRDAGQNWMGTVFSCCIQQQPHQTNTRSAPQQKQIPTLQLQNDIQLNSPLFDAHNKFQTTPQLPDESVIQIYERARYLASCPQQALAWKLVKDSRKSYYFNQLTSKVSLTLPDNITLTTSSDQHIKPSIQCFPALLDLCSAMNITIEFASPDPYYRSLLSYQTPTLCSALYSIPLIQRVIEAYPKSVWTKVCHRIVLCESITFDDTSRDAVPVVHSRSLYVALKCQECVFYMSMIHHEIFHLIDAVYFESVGQSNVSDAMHACDYVDPEWQMLNLPNFQYGIGGDKPENRSPEMSMSGAINGQAVPRGFVSRYAMSDAAEDRAEIFSAMMRNYLVYYNSEDIILQQKCDIIRSRVQAVCSSFDSVWWNNVVQSHCFSIVTDSNWTSMTDSHCRQFWYNHITGQSAVLR